MQQIAYLNNNVNAFDKSVVLNRRNSRININALALKVLYYLDK